MIHPRLLPFCILLLVPTSLLAEEGRDVNAERALERVQYTVDVEAEPCVASETVLCLVDGRFEVNVAWQDKGGNDGFAEHVELSDGAGYFWFFDRDNPELFVKVIDACGSPFDRYWVFVAGLTDVGVAMTVTDTETGAVRNYINPLGNRFESVQDTDAFATCGTP